MILFVLTETLKLLHPYMPFITEEIYLSLPHTDQSIMVSAFPKAEEIPAFGDKAAEFERVLDVVAAVRTRRAEMNVPPSRRAKMYLVTAHPESYEGAHAHFAKLCGASETELVDRYDSDDAVSIVTSDATVYIPMRDMIDFDKERARLNGEMTKIQGEIARAESKLANESFTAKAPAAVVAAERDKLAKAQATAVALAAALAKLG